MSYLLDTHTILWFLVDSKELPRNTQKLIEEADDVSVSIVSFLEMAIKNSRGKFPLPLSITEMMRLCRDNLGFSILAIRDIHLETLRALPWVHKDPFDRLIISQAISEDMTLVSVDAHVAEYPVRRVWEK